MLVKINSLAAIIVRLWAHRNLLELERMRCVDLNPQWLARAWQ